MTGVRHERAARLEREDHRGVPGQRGPQGADDDGAADKDATRTGVVGVCQRQPSQRLAADDPGGREIRGEIRADRASEQDVQQLGADRGTELLADVTVAKAAPTSCGATPKVPVLIYGAVTVPVPIAARISGPSTPAAYPVCGPNWPARPFRRRSRAGYRCRCRRRVSGSTLLGCLRLVPGAPPNEPPLTPQAPSQKGWFRVRPQAHSAARVSASGPPGCPAQDRRGPGVDHPARAPSVSVSGK